MNPPETTLHLVPELPLRRGDPVVPAFEAPEAIAVVDVDPDGRVLTASREHLAILGASESELAGRRVHEMLVSPDLFEVVWSRLIRGQAVEPGPVAWRTRGGEIVPLVLHAAALRTVNRRLVMRWYLRLVH